MINKDAILEIYDSASPEWTFERLDAACEIPPATTSTPLDQWFSRVKAKKIAVLDDGDLAKALRQRVHVPVVLMAALNRLLKDPLAGDQTPGELMSAVLDVPAVVWTDFSGVVSTMQHVAEQALAQPREVPEWKAIAARLQRWLSAMEPPLGHLRLVAAGKEQRREVRQGERITVGSAVGDLLKAKDLSARHLILNAKDGVLRLLALEAGVTKNGEAVNKEVTLAIGDVVQANGVELRFEA